MGRTAKLKGWAMLALLAAGIAAGCAALKESRPILPIRSTKR